MLSAETEQLPAAHAWRNTTPACTSVPLVGHFLTIYVLCVDVSWFSPYDISDYFGSTHKPKDAKYAGALLKICQFDKISSTNLRICVHANTPLACRSV